MNKNMADPTFSRNQFLKYCLFFIAPGSRILMLGCPGSEFLERLRPSEAVGVVTAGASEDRLKSDNPDIAIYRETDPASFTQQEIFDYIILDGIPDEIVDVRRFLTGLLKMAVAETRIIVNTFYYRRISPGGGIKTGFSGAAGWRKPLNLFPLPDLKNFLNISGYEIIRQENYWFPNHSRVFTATFFNRFLAGRPFLKRFSPGRLLVTRPLRPLADSGEMSISVVLTCRDEEGNIEELIKRIPDMGKKTEIVFVEGHSLDNTVGKIKDMIKRYPHKDIKLYHQSGIGQGDAFRLGFNRAAGDFLIWMEADLTTPPEEARHIWEAYAAGHGEYINGSRFVYPMAPGAMPLPNRLGNRFFSRLISLVTGRRFTDTLCGFKGISRAGYARITADRNHFDDLDPFGDFLLILGAVKYNLKIAEVPVHYRPRQYGRSKAYGSSWFGLLSHARPLLTICCRALVDFRLLR